MLTMNPSTAFFTCHCIATGLHDIISFFGNFLYSYFICFWSGCTLFFAAGCSLTGWAIMGNMRSLSESGKRIKICIQIPAGQNVCGTQWLSWTFSTASYLFWKCSLIPYFYGMVVCACRRGRGNIDMGLFTTVLIKSIILSGLHTSLLSFLLLLKVAGIWLHTYHFKSDK